jgi:hypothetical protein
MKLSTLLLDHYDMLGAGQVDIKELQKVADALGGRIMSPEDRERQVDGDFGIVLIASSGDRIRRFPLGTPADTFLSKTSAKMNQGHLPKGARNVLSHRLDVACERFNLPVHSSMMQKHASKHPPSPIYLLSELEESDLNFETMVKRASYGHYAINTSLHGEKRAQFPIDSPRQVKLRINAFESKHNKMHIKYAFQYADNVFERATELNVKVPEGSKIHLYKEARLNPRFGHFVDERIQMAPESLQASYLGLMLKKASHDPRQLAVALDALDRSCGMDSHWGTQIACPAESTLTIAKISSTVSIGEVMIDTQDLVEDLHAHPEAYNGVIDESTVAALIAEPEKVLRSLPVPHRQAVLETFSSHSS